MPRTRLAACSLLALAVASWAGRADAAATVAVLGIEPIGTSETNATALADALRTRLRDMKSVTVATAKDFMEIKFLFNCMDPETITTCLSAAGKSLNVERFIVGTVSVRKQKAKHLQVVLKLIETATAAPSHVVDEEVPIGDLLSPENIGRWADALLADAGGSGQVAVSSSPLDAKITVDGKYAGTTPATVALSAGGHSVALSRDGFQSESRVITVRPGERAKLSLELTRLAPPPVARVESPPPSTDNVLVVAPPVKESAGEERPGRTAKVVAGVSLAVALAGAGISIYTWRHYTDLRDTAHNTLDLVRTGDPAYAAANPDFFYRTPSCSFPTDKPPHSSNATPYVNQCNEGTAYANATTGLVVGSSVLAAIAVASFAGGMYQSGHVDHDKRAAATGPRLRLVSPVITHEGGGISAAFEF
jgi:hypothetical protein